MREDFCEIPQFLLGTVEFIHSETWWWIKKTRRSYREKNFETPLRFFVMLSYLIWLTSTLISCDQYRVQTLHILSNILSLMDFDVRGSWHLVCSLIYVARVINRDYDHCKCPKLHLKHWFISYENLTNIGKICTNVWDVFWDTCRNHRFSKYFFV